MMMMVMMDDGDDDDDDKDGDDDGDVPKCRYGDEPGFPALVSALLGRQHSSETFERTDQTRAPHGAEKFLRKLGVKWEFINIRGFDTPSAKLVICLVPPWCQA